MRNRCQAQEGAESRRRRKSSGFIRRALSHGASTYSSRQRVALALQQPTGSRTLNSQPSTINHVSDGWRVIQERDANNTPIVSYTRGRDLSGSMEGAGGIGGLLARSDGYSSSTGNWSTHNYYFADGNGNITYMLNSSQAMVASHRYDPFGNTISSSGSLAPTNVYRSSSKEIHVNSGLYYYGYRFYDPGTERWINKDPLGQFIEDNLYRFAANAGVLHVDTDGRSIFGSVSSWWQGLLGKGACALGMGALSRYSDMSKGGDRYAHCMASCRIKKNCGQGAAVTAGFAKEVYDLAVCLATWNQNYCYSAFQKSDLDDNKTGRSCPKDKPCDQYCKDKGLYNASEPPPGPFYPWPPPVPDPAYWP